MERMNLSCTKCLAFTNEEVVKKVGILIKPVIFIEKKDKGWISALYTKTINPVNKEEYQQLIKDICNFALLLCDDIEKVCALFSKEREILKV